MSVVLNTTFGAIKIDLHHKDVPITCRNFVELCKAGYYDGCSFHRVVPDFCQTGDPTGTCTGGESIYGKFFDDEISAKYCHKEGAVAMANSGRNTNASQFFIMLRESTRLDGKYTIFGQVTPDSFEILNQFKHVETRNDKPKKPLKLFGANVMCDPWESLPLPKGAVVPDKPLIETNECCVIL